MGGLFRRPARGVFPQDSSAGLTAASSSSGATQRLAAAYGEPTKLTTDERAACAWLPTRGLNSLFTLLAEIPFRAALRIRPAAPSDDDPSLARFGERGFSWVGWLGGLRLPLAIAANSTAQEPLINPMGSLVHLTVLGS